MVKIALLSSTNTVCADISCWRPATCSYVIVAVVSANKFSLISPAITIRYCMRSKTARVIHDKRR